LRVARESGPQNGGYSTGAFHVLRNVTSLAGRRGAVVAIDPDNGEVLAFTSTPGYDPNAISAGLSRRAYLALQEKQRYK